MKGDEETGGGPGSKSKCSLVHAGIKDNVVESKKVLTRRFQLMTLTILGLIMVLMVLRMHLGHNLHLN